MSGLVLAPVFAQADLQNFQELPTGLRDARAPSGLAIQGTAGYRREAEGNNIFALEPQISYGRSNWYGEVSYLLAAGPGGRRNAGDIHFVLFRQLNGENGGIPVFSVLAAAEAPTGIQSAGLDTRLQGNISKSLGAGRAAHRLHLNAAWLHNAAPRDDERSNLYRIAAGYSRKLGETAVVIAGYLRQEQKERGHDLSLLELGFRIRISKNTIISIGGGAGIHSRPARSQAVIGLERSY